MSDNAIIVMTAIICMTVAIVVATICKHDKDMTDGDYVTREEYQALMELTKELTDYVVKQNESMVKLTEDIKQLRRDHNITNEKVHRLWSLIPNEEDKS